MLASLFANAEEPLLLGTVDEKGDALCLPVADGDGPLRAAVIRVVFVVSAAGQGKAVPLREEKTERRGREGGRIKQTFLPVVMSSDRYYTLLFLFFVFSGKPTVHLKGFDLCFF